MLLFFVEFVFTAVSAAIATSADDVRKSRAATKRIYMKPVNKFPKVHPLGDRKFCGGPTDPEFISHEGLKQTNAHFAFAHPLFSHIDYSFNFLPC